MYEHAALTGGSLVSLDGSPAAPPHLPIADYAVVGRLRQDVANDLATYLRDHDLTEKSQQQYARTLIQQHVVGWADELVKQGGQAPTRADEFVIADAIYAALFGMGRFQPLLDDTTVENIEVDGCDQVWVTRRRGEVTEVSRAAAVADSDEELIGFLQQLASRTGQRDRSFTRANPRLHLRLPDGSRLAALAWTSHRPTVVIRRHRVHDVDLARLVTLGMMSPELADFLRAAVLARKNIVVTGRQNTGKTTLVRALANEVDPGERIATIEKEYELHLHESSGRHRRIVALESRDGSAEHTSTGHASGQVTLTDLLTDALRLNLTRIIVGEVRGDEIVSMLDAMSTGDGGSMCTLHARTARDAIDRMTGLCLRAEPGMSALAAYHMLSAAVDVIVHLRMHDSSSQRGGQIVRFVDEVVELHDGLGETGRPATTTLFAPDAEGRVGPRHRPSFLHELEQTGLSRIVFDTRPLSHIEPDARRRGSR